MLAASNDTSSRVQTIMKYIGYDFNTNSIHGNVIPAFVNYFYTSATFNDALYKNGLVSKFNELFNQIIGTPTTEIPSYSDITVQAYHNGEIKEVTLESMKGHWSVVEFYPQDLTFVCPKQ